MANAADLIVPASRPRLWFNADRLAAARQWYVSNPFTPAASNPLGQAMRYLMTGEVSYARAAIGQLMAFTVPESQLAGVASNDYRWNDWVPLVYDWCYEQMTPDERQTFLDRYNRYTDILLAKSWGGPGMSFSNYFWGYWRNAMNWAIASHGENPMAQQFIDDCLEVRWNDDFLPQTAAGGFLDGGVAPEGSQYGRYILGYPVVPLATTGMMGVDLFSETNFYIEAAYALIYSLTPGPTASPFGTFYQFFPFADDEQSGGFPRLFSYDTYLGDFMTLVAQRLDGTPLAAYARRWLANTGASVLAHIRSVDVPAAGIAADFSALPTEYYAPGSQCLYARSDWSPSATSILFQLGLRPSSHSHRDTGSFQILRNGRWLAKESTGYARLICGYGAAGSAPTNSTLAHNGILFGGMGLANDHQDGPPRVTRLETRPSHVFVAADLTPSYQTLLYPWDSSDNPHVGRCVREFLYVRSMDVLLVFDRLLSTAAHTLKTFLLHFPVPPVITSPNSIECRDGGQVLALNTFAGGQNLSYRVVDESINGTGGEHTDFQHRLEAEVWGQAQTHLLSVLQCRDEASPAVGVEVTETPDEVQVTLTHPVQGTAVARFAKGEQSQGGTFNGQPLADQVQEITVTDQGVFWGTPSSPLLSPPQDLAAAEVSHDRVVLTWVPTSGAGTLIDRRQVVDDPLAGQWHWLVTMAAGQSTYHDTSVLPGTSYEYRVLSARDLEISAPGAVLAVTTPPPPDTTGPAIFNAQLLSASPSHLEVAWETDEPSDSRLEYGPDQNYGNVTVLDPQLTTQHQVRIDGLEHSTAYYLRCLSRDSSGNLSAVAVGFFVTLTPPPPPAPAITVVPNDPLGYLFTLGPVEGADIFYTTNGDPPAQAEAAAIVYTAPFHLPASRLVRAVAVRQGQTGPESALLTLSLG